jgi:NTE family protein
MVDKRKKRRVAIACQGGGSHTAFTAGALKTILKQPNPDVEIVALSGTSGGAICALMGWYGLLVNDAAKGVELLDSFWRNNSASLPWEQYLNSSLLLYSRLHSIFPFPQISPYTYPTWAQELLRTLLEKNIPFEKLKRLIRESSPILMVGAVDVLSGQFKVFDSRKGEIQVEAILASAAIPDFFRAVQIDHSYYWDGLFSQNPPIRDLTDAQPDEIWVIQINPGSNSHEPKSIDAIRDRRNELAGNLSLEQEIYFIEKINDFVRKKLFVDSKYKPIQVHRIKMLRDLDYASKLDRSPAFIQDLIRYGEMEAAQFLQLHPSIPSNP